MSSYKQMKGKCQKGGPVTLYDYLNQSGRGSGASYGAGRKELAKQAGISNYSGTAQQNEALLRYLRSMDSSSYAQPESSAYGNRSIDEIRPLGQMPSQYSSNYDDEVQMMQNGNMDLPVMNTSGYSPLSGILTNNRLLSFLPRKQQGGSASPINNKVRQDWNAYIDYLRNQHLAGDPSLDTAGKGYDVLDQYIKTNPNTSLNREIIQPLQNDFQSYRTYALNNIKNNKAAFSEGTNEQNFMQNLSKIDGYPGMNTTSFKFPMEYLRMLDQNTGTDTTINKGFAVSRQMGGVSPLSFRVNNRGKFRMKGDINQFSSMNGSTYDPMSNLTNMLGTYQPGFMSVVEGMRNGAYDELKSGGWIKNAVNPEHEGYCTPMTKSTCTPRRKAFAMRAKAHFKQQGGTAEADYFKANVLNNPNMVFAVPDPSSSFAGDSVRIFPHQRRPNGQVPYIRDLGMAAGFSSIPNSSLLQMYLNNKGRAYVDSTYRKANPTLIR